MQRAAPSSQGGHSPDLPQLLLVFMGMEPYCTTKLPFPTVLEGERGGKCAWLIPASIQVCPQDWYLLPACELL